MNELGLIKRLIDEGMLKYMTSQRRVSIELVPRNLEVLKMIEAKAPELINYSLVGIHNSGGFISSATGELLDYVRERIVGKVQKLFSKEVEDPESLDVENGAVLVSINNNNIGYFIEKDYDCPYSLSELLSGESKEEPSEYNFREAWDVIEDQASDPGYEIKDMPNIMDLIREKLQGAMFEVNGEVLTFGTEKAKKYVEEVGLRDLIEDHRDDKFEVGHYSENAGRIREIFDKIINSYHYTFYEGPLQMSQDYMAEYLNDDLAREDITIDLYDNYIRIEMSMDKLKGILEEYNADYDTIQVVSTLASYFEDKNLSSVLYYNDPNNMDEGQYMVRDIIEMLKELKDLKVTKPVHPDQLWFPGMKPESVSRFKELAGLNE